MKRPSLVLTVVCLAAATVAVVAVASPLRGAAPAAAPAPSVKALQDAFVAVFRKVSPSVVQIQTSSGLGSGIVFDAKGHVVTNDHVVAGSRTAVVTTAAGRRLEAKLVGEFPADDLAVLAVAPAGLKPAVFADSGKLQVGQIAIAIGNPLGLSSSVTEGIVSALNRQVPEGNGIPTLAAAAAQTGGAAPGIGFAIPSSVVRDIAGQLIRHGRVVNSHRAYLGIQVADTGRGVYVAAVGAGGPAAKAGIVVGDLIVSVAGKATPTSDDLGAVLAGLRPKQAVKVGLVRQNATNSTVAVTLGELPGS